MVIANSISLTLISTSTSFFTRKSELNGEWMQPVLIGICASIFSIFSFQFIVLQGFVNKQVLAVLLLLTIVFTMIRNLLRKSNKQNEPQKIQNLNGLHSLIIGALSGFFASISGLGGGVIIVPLLTEIYKINLRLSQTISLLVVSISSFFLTVSNLISFENKLPDQASVYRIEFILPVIIGILIGTPIGNWLYPKIPISFNKIIFIIVLSYLAYVNLKLFLNS